VLNPQIDWYRLFFIKIALGFYLFAAIARLNGTWLGGWLFVLAHTL